jgi:predicted N-acetyltransferase YhbS
MTDTYDIRPAKRSDITAILRLIDEAARWLQASRGTDQWARPWPNLAARDERIAQGIEHGLTWIAEGEGSLLGTVTYREQGRDSLWAPAELAEPAVYVSRLIVGRGHAGQGIGAALIDWAGLRGLREWQANWLRVDVWTTNAALHGYYKDQGFTHLRTVPFETEWDYPSAALFQKPTSEIDLAAARRFTEFNADSLVSQVIRELSLSSD